MNHKESGQVSRVLIILGLVIILAAVLVYFGLRYATNKRAAEEVVDETPEVVEPPKPVYEVQIGDIKLTLQSSRDLGNVLHVPSSFNLDATTTEKFIMVTVGAQNKGKVDTMQFAWELGNLIDSEGRIFTPADQKGYYYLQRYKNFCGAGLKPEFAPLSCIRMYEVSRQSTGLKLEVRAAAAENEKTLELLDLNLNQ